MSLSVDEEQTSFLNHDKGHVRITSLGLLETAKKASLRELFEEISIRKRTSRKAIQITIKNCQKLPLKLIGYIQCHLDSKPGSHDQNRLIGLFVYHINQTRLRFQLKDKNENQVKHDDHCLLLYINLLCFQKLAWVNIDTILSTDFQPNYDPYYTLRPFAR